MQGKSINGFTLQRPLGTGGMAEVWYAENKIGKKAAVKMLLLKLCADENVCSRFYTEAKVMVELDHPNIRQVYDYGDIDGRPAIVMEYLEGDDLKTRMKRGQRFTDEELKRWWNQLVSALNYTHQKGIVHRDIKPGNIFVDKRGDVKLLDFGIAKVRDSISTTLTGQTLGTLLYMSPEQVNDSKHIDYRSDLYSLAVTFVHLVTGKKPYDSDTSSDFEIREQIVRKSMDLSGLPGMWRSFLSPYLEKDKEKRPELCPLMDTDDYYDINGGDDDGGIDEDVSTWPNPEERGETHVFNEQKKRLDPIENRCMCCGEGFSRGVEDNYYIPLFKESDRTNLLVYRNVKYSQINVGVTRCAKCKELQKTAKTKSVFYGIGVGIGVAAFSIAVGFALGVFLDLIVIGSILTVIGVIAGVFIGLSKAGAYEEKMLNLNKVLTRENAARRYPIVEALLSDGWTFIVPTA